VQEWEGDEEAPITIGRFWSKKDGGGGRWRVGRANIRFLCAGGKKSGRLASGEQWKRKGAVE